MYLISCSSLKPSPNSLKRNQIHNAILHFEPKRHNSGTHYHSTLNNITLNLQEIVSIDLLQAAQAPNRRGPNVTTRNIQELERLLRKPLRDTPRHKSRNKSDIVNKMVIKHIKSIINPT